MSPKTIGWSCFQRDCAFVYNCSTRVGVRIQVKLVFLEDVAQEKMGDNWRHFYITAAAVMFVYLAMSHMYGE